MPLGHIGTGVVILPESLWLPLGHIGTGVVILA